MIDRIRIRKWLLNRRVSKSFNAAQREMLSGKLKPMSVDEIMRAVRK